MDSDEIKSGLDIKDHERYRFILKVENFERKDFGEW
jgi:hypothetical protein